VQSLRPLFITPALVILLLAGCTSTRSAAPPEPAAAPPVAVTATPAPEPPLAPPQVDVQVALASPPEDWFHLDEGEQGIRGVSTERAYRTVLNGRQPQRTVVVAVIDGGVDVNHEDLDDRIWINTDEIAGNGVDDDRNGYVDDVHGWNFIGGPNGQSVNFDTYELTREYVRLSEKYEGMTAAQVPSSDAEEFAYYQEVVEDFNETRQEQEGYYAQLVEIDEVVQYASGIVRRHLGRETFTRDDVASISTPQLDVMEARRILLQVYDQLGATPEMLTAEVENVRNSLEYSYNPEFDPRSIVGDDYADTANRFYGNNDVAGPDPGHGTSVAGVIAAERNNGLGINGIADSVRIMAVRAVPNGDERDKDVANAIRYAVDNGAHIVNMSFGKAYSPEKSLVDEAVRYAAERGVLLVHAAGNSGEDIDVEPNYPTKILAGDVWAENWLEVGASSWAPGADAVASFSNYGAREVDVFAPGVAIYTTSPGSEYGPADGTSLAAPVVSGIAALIMSHYPELTAEQVQDIIMDSAVRYPGAQVTIPGGGQAVRFETLSASGGLVNAVTALQAAAAL
jgi:subtilisin family serine protease